MNVVCGRYRLRDWDEKRDWPPEGFDMAAYALDYDNAQVGAVAGSMDHVIKIQTKPKGVGHGTKLLEIMMIEAKGLGRTCFTVEGVIGDTDEDKEAIEHILTKLGLEKKDEQTWFKSM